MENVDFIKAWKDSNYLQELRNKGIVIENPVEDTFNLALIQGGQDWVHTISGECNPMGHVHNCRTLDGADQWFADTVGSLFSFTC